MSERPDVAYIEKRTCPECSRLMSGSTWDNLHMEEDHDYENVDRTDGDDVEWDTEAFISKRDLEEWLRRNKPDCECMEELRNLLNQISEDMHKKTTEGDME